jgi:hypothetical protein
MTCPHCSSTAPQKRADGRCAACGKLLPKELRGTPEPLPLVGVESSLMKPGDGCEWYDHLEPGDIVVLLQLHQNRFGLKRVTPAEAAILPGPKYIVPPEWDQIGVFFTVDGWEEYDGRLSEIAVRKPWWKFW